MPKYVLYTWKKSKFNGLQIGPSNLSFLRIYVQGVLMGFYGDYNWIIPEHQKLLSFSKIERHIAWSI